MSNAGISAYRSTAVFLLNCVLVFVALNVALWIAFETYPRVRRLWRKEGPKTAVPLKPGQPVDNGRRNPYQLMCTDTRAYEGVAPAEVETALDDFTALQAKGFEYEPWVQFGEPEFAGSLVHVDVDPRGFRYRRTVSAASVPTEGARFDVFVFGGSTTFGYNVADAWTFPSYLQEELDHAVAADEPRLRPRVSNWGRGYFYSSQEVALFMTLLRRGYRPHAAFFLDGLNDVGILLVHPSDTPWFTEKTVALWRQAQIGGPRPAPAEHFDWLPIARLAKLIRKDLAWPPVPAAEPPQAPAQELNVPALVESTLSNYQGNLRVARALCKEFEVQCFFLWQPVAFVDYDTTLQRSFPDNGTVKKAFEICWERVQELPEPPIYLGRLPREYGARRRIFVDDCHYGPAFSRFLAQRVAAAAGPFWRNQARIHPRPTDRD